MDKVLTQIEYEMGALWMSIEDKVITKPGELNVLACEDILLSIDTKTTAGKSLPTEGIHLPLLCQIVGSYAVRKRSTL